MRTAAFVAGVVLSGCLLASGAGCARRGGGAAFAQGSTSPAVTASPEVVLQVGPGLTATVASRVEALVRGATTRPVRVEAASASVGSLGSGSLVIALGETSTTRALVTSAEVAALGSEGFILRSKTDKGVTTVATDGPGVRFGTYALLEELGFAFLHPLAPTKPAELSAPASPLDRTEEPRWPFRGIHLHTMHPTELTELLNGWGVGDPNDQASFASMLPEWDLVCEWAVANKLNRIEWFLLAATSWQSFAGGTTRQARLAEIVARAHAWGLKVGADVPFALRQQHAWTMIEKFGNRAQELAQIRARVAWLDQAGFDFVGTEMGTSEFTPTEDREMVAWMDELAAATDAIGMRCYVKAHCSTGQFAKNYPDPLTGGQLNYNYLVRVADPRLGVYPHTVQMYGLDDPAPTYGNVDFDYVRTFLQEEAGRREVVWYPETAYWVSYDVDVPLFLPVYAERRLHDLRLIASDERAGRVGRGARAGGRIDGQMTFSSGWEWGYWLNDVVAARASWQPYENEPSDEAALEKLLEPLVRVLGAAGPDARRSLLEVCRSQNDLLIHGRVNGATPSAIEKRNGIAYIQGWEAFDDLACSLDGIVPLHETQPAKLGLVDMRLAAFTGKGPDYTTHVEPLLAAMSADFTKHSADIDALRAKAPATARDLLDDMADAAAMTALRARQVHGLYDYVAGGMTPSAAAKARLQDARNALDAALLVVQGREPRYRVPADRIAGWRKNPTSYAFTYLWTVRSLHYWWRDEVKAVDMPLSPFEMNLMSPTDIALGENAFIPFLKAARAWGNAKGFGFITQGLAEPANEPVYLPSGPNDVRKRP